MNDVATTVDAHSAASPKAQFRRLPVVFVAVLCSALLAITLLLLSFSRLLPDGPEEWTLDWRTAHFSKRATTPRDDIAIVLVTEDTLAQYPSRSPVDRGLLAELVRAIDAARPKLIALDFIFDRPTEIARDNELIAAIREAKTPIILGGVDGRATRLHDRARQFQQEFLTKAGRPVGHVFFAGHEARIKISDQVVRETAETKSGATYSKSLAEIIAEITNSKPQASNRIVAWLLPPNDGKDDLFPSIPVPEHIRSDQQGARPPLFDQYEAALLRGRTVLVGGSFLDRDQHLTPLTLVDGERTPGVMIHAQILAQLLDGRQIVTVPPLLEFVALLFVALMAFCLGRRWQLGRYNLLVNLTGIVVLVAVSVLLFSHVQVLVPSTTLFFAWIGGVTLGHFSHSMTRTVRLT